MTPTIAGNTRTPRDMPPNATSHGTSEVGRLRLVLSGMALGLSVVLGGSGCHSMDSHGSLYRQWSDRMAEMGIFPVYPPREDIVVGDVYALPLHPYDTAAVGYIGGLGNAGVHLEYLGDTSLGWESLSKPLDEYYQSRPYPADSTNNLALGTASPLTQIASFDDPTMRTNIFGRGSTARLRQVSFPDFTITHVGQRSLAAVVPIEGIMAGMNFNRNDISAVHLSIPHAESYGVTAERLLYDVHGSGLLTNFQGRIYMKADTNSVVTVLGARLAYAMFQDIMNQVINDPFQSIPRRVRHHMNSTLNAMHDRIYLAVISEVYFARSMDITIDRKKAWGAGAAARPIGISELRQLKDLGLLGVRSHTNSITTTTTTKIADGSTNVIVETKAQLVDLSEGDTAYDLARKLRGIETSTSMNDIGGSVRILSVSTSSIGLRRTFQRPVCVGVRGLIMKLVLDQPADLERNGRKEWLPVETPSFQ
ncbi:MAG: hypothetical protein AB9869_00335 [Verrucomicrobiia bacterium]